MNVLLFKSHCNIFIGFGIIKELLGLVGSGTPCINIIVGTIIIHIYDMHNAYDKEEGNAKCA
jgi:hypothetical protein